MADLADTTKIATGPCSITFGSDDLGYTQGDLRFTYKPTYRERTVDEMGGTPLDFIHTGEDIKVTVTLKQEQVELLQILAPEGVAGGSTKWYLGRGPGGKASTHAQQLTLTPINSSATTIQQIVFWKAVIIEGFERTFSYEEDSNYEVTFQILWDSSKSDGQRLGYVEYQS